MSSPAAFSPDYETARRRFRDAATRLNWARKDHSIMPPHPVAQDLTVDVATNGPKESGRTVIVSSGLHGVEAYIGSAVQLELLEKWAKGPGPPPSVRCVFLHALNPYGFACVRRVNEDNVDPNRNFLPKGEQYAGSPAGYASLYPLLSPERAPSNWEPFAIKAFFATLRHGKAALKQSVAMGQFDYPRGLFYGGSRPSRTHEILAENLARWIQGCEEVIHLDFHTGLGPRATCTLLIDYPLSERQEARLTDWFGPDSFEISDPALISYHVRGGFDRWCVDQFPGVDYLHLCAEFGTYSPFQVISGLRAENQAHHWGRPSDRFTVLAKARLKELFCPAAPDWRARTLATGVDLVEKALNCLEASAKRHQ